MTTYEPGTYVKGDVEKVAKTASQAVALTFDGYQRKADAEEAPAPVASETPAPERPAADPSPLSKPTNPSAVFGRQKDAK